MDPKRKVSANLGRTQHHWADKWYADIKKRNGPYRRCPFYNGKKYSQYGPSSHDKLNPRYPNPKVPIEQFDFAKKTNGTWGLQAYCKVCYKAYRSARIDRSRSTWVRANGKAFTDKEIRTWYRKNVGPTMICSVCKRALVPEEFRVSRSMEKGLHNVCSSCMAASGTSVREQILLADGNWNSWRRSVALMRQNKKVPCAGWPRSVAAGACHGTDDGKKMHADHRVPLRAGGIHDARNFQALCSACNIRKLHQIDTKLTARDIKQCVGKAYQSLVHERESVETIERRLKSAVRDRIRMLVVKDTYRAALVAKKKEVNGQWDIEHAYRKGVEWIRKGDRVLDTNGATV